MLVLSSHLYILKLGYLEAWCVQYRRRIIDLNFQTLKVFQNINQVKLCVQKQIKGPQIISWAHEGHQTPSIASIKVVGTQKAVKAEARGWQST